MTTDTYVGMLLVLVALLYATIIVLAGVLFVGFRRIRAADDTAAAARESFKGAERLIEVTRALGPKVESVEKRLAAIEMRLGGIPGWGR